jgi:hypothetical protein
MFEDFTWRRGSGELGVIDRFAELAKKASEEAHADVLVILNFPAGYLTVIGSTPEQPARPGPRGRTWTPRAVAKGLRLLRQWLRGLNEGGDDKALREEIDRFNTIKKHDPDNL